MKWTLITGGSKGLGCAVAEFLASLGYPIVIHYRNSSREAKETIKLCRSFGVPAEMIQADFSDAASVKEFADRYLQQFSETAHLINNVGPYFIGSSLQTSVNIWEQIFFSNVHVPFILSAVLAKTIARERGTITNIGIAGLCGARGDVYSTAYTCAKKALLELTRSLAKELAPEGARVNMVSPGYLENAIDLPKDLNKIPLGRATTLKEAASAIGFLMDPSNSSVTGQNLEVAGGVRL